MQGIVKAGVDGKFHLFVNNQDTGLKSKDSDYFEYVWKRGEVEKLKRLGLTSIVKEDTKAVVISTPTQISQAVSTVVQAEAYTVDEKFEMMEQLVEMTVKGTTKGMLICGRGGIGKSWTVQSVLDRLNKKDLNKARVELEEQRKALAITTEDDDEEVVDKIDELLQIPKGDYVIIKGYVTPSALYRLLYEHRNRIVVFDDCDRVIRDDNAINVLKGALDTYEERWVHWQTNSTISDLPSCFKFEGQVIVISNMNISQIDEAFRTRCFKVDVAMSPEQRIQRMRTVLHDVMPHVDYNHKLEALELMADSINIAQDISFRSLMSVITIRTEPSVKNWKRMARYSLAQGM